MIRKKRVGWHHEWGCVRHLPAFLRWSSIITDDIMNTLPMLPMTDRHANTNNLAMLGHSVDSVTGEKSFMCGLLLLLKP